jgi:hypothetical protein
MAVHSRSDFKRFFCPLYIMRSSSTKLTLKFLAKNFLCVFFGDLQNLITLLIFAKNSQIFPNICEAILQKILRLFFHYGRVEKRSSDRINEKYDMFQTA